MYGLTFFDFDHPTKPENAFADAQRLSQYLTDLNVAHWVQYSGSKGYHLFPKYILRLDSSLVTRMGRAKRSRLLSIKLKKHLKHTLGLNTLDEQTTGGPKRLCRMPYTRHVDRHGKVTGRYALPIPTSKLLDISHDEIVARSYIQNTSCQRLG
ncbi:MAG: hypothetical protein CM15mV29_1050 [uncultured marine virus]|nr:MAG: hypothetical protein CM15mV29_1050 [uncultured marine virus]